MEPVTVPLTGTEAAFVQMVLEEHQALMRNADARRDGRMKVLLEEKQIPAGVPVRIEAVDGGSALVYTPLAAPEMPPADVPPSDASQEPA